MFSPAFRLLLVLTCVALAFRAPAPAQWLLFASAGLLLVGFWRSGSVWLAWRAYKAGNLSRMQRRLAWTRPFAYLAPRQRAYFELLEGVSRRAEGDLVAARKHLMEAAGRPFRTSIDRGEVYAHLAELALEMGDGQAAAVAVEQGRALRPLGPLGARIDQVERELMSASQPAAHASHPPIP